MSGFRKLVESCNKVAKEELEDFYYIKESNMNNLLYCLESGSAKIRELKSEVEQLQAENASLRNALIGLYDHKEQL